MQSRSPRGHLASRACLATAAVALLALIHSVGPGPAHAQVDARTTLAVSDPGLTPPQNDGAGAKSPDYPAFGDQVLPSVAFDGTNYLVVWQDHRSGTSDIYAARMSPTGTLLDEGGFPISIAPDDQSAPRVAFGGTEYLVGWTDYRSGSSPDIYGARVNTAGGVLDPSGFGISTAANTQFRT